MDEVGRDHVTGRPLFVLDVTSPDDVPAVFPGPGPYFICLLVWDARGVSTDVIRIVADRVLRSGCVYAVCWGPDCERVHDILDEVDLQFRPDGPWAMTTWHNDEPLAEAIWFALFAAWPDDAFVDGCHSLVAVSLGSPAWASEVRAAFENSGEFSQAWLADEDSPNTVPKTNSFRENNES